MTLKNVWLTDNDQFVSLSLESADPSQSHTRIQFRDSLYPENPTPERPLRHVLVIQCLTDEDLIMLHKTIGHYLGFD